MLALIHNPLIAAPKSWNCRHGPLAASFLQLCECERECVCVYKTVRVYESICVNVSVCMCAQVCE